MQRLEENDAPYEELLEFALSLSRDARTSYAAAEPPSRRFGTRPFLTGSNSLAGSSPTTRSVPRST
jgi:hypothetical protein